MFAEQLDLTVKNQKICVTRLLSILTVDSKEFLINLHRTKLIDYDPIN